MKKVFYIFYIFPILLLFFTLNGFSQEDSINKKNNIIPINVPNINSIAVGSGYSQFKALDEKANQLIFKAQLVPVYFAYSKESEKRIFNINIDIRNGLIDNNQNNSEIQPTNRSYNYLVQDEINVEYARKINQKRKQKVDLFIGGQLKQYYSMSLADVPIYVSSELSINPMFLTNYHINETIALKSLVSISIASINTNIPYQATPTVGTQNNFFSTFFSETDYTTINHYKRINFHPSLEKKLTDRWTFSIDYIFRWSHYTHANNNLSTYDNSILVKFIKKII